MEQKVLIQFFKVEIMSTNTLKFEYIDERFIFKQ